MKDKGKQLDREIEMKLKAYRDRLASYPMGKYIHRENSNRAVSDSSLPGKTEKEKAKEEKKKEKERRKEEEKEREREEKRRKDEEKERKKEDKQMEKEKEKEIGKEKKVKKERERERSRSKEDGRDGGDDAFPRMDDDHNRAEKRHSHGGGQRRKRSLGALQDMDLFGSAQNMDTDWPPPELSPPATWQLAPAAVFCLVSLEGRGWSFQAPSVEECDLWVSALQDQILHGLTLNTTNAPHGMRLAELVPEETLENIKKVPGNTHCADCGAQGPDWASINLGILLCIKCSGIHRNLGVQVSRVRSLVLDAWGISSYEVMLSIGNQAANAVWEVGVEDWIRRKYVLGAFRAPCPDDVTMDNIAQALCDSLSTGQYADARLLLAHGGLHALLGTSETTPLHVVSQAGLRHWVQYLLWAGADPQAKDSSGRTPIEVATTGGYPAVVDLLQDAVATYHRPDLSSSQTLQGVGSMSV